LGAKGAGGTYWKFEIGGWRLEIRFAISNLQFPISNRFLKTPKVCEPRVRYTLCAAHMGQTNQEGKEFAAGWMPAQNIKIHGGYLK